jgi:transcriptional regulator of acetoin/glycerol metabolism
VWCSCRPGDGAGTADPTNPDDTPAPPAAEPAPAPASTAQTLQDADRHLVQRTLQACGGNVSQAARRLGVSRGLVYRHLKATNEH